MTEKEKAHPSMSPFASDLYAPWLTTMKNLIASSLDTNEKLAKDVLAWIGDATTWAKDTPWAPVCKTFIASTSKMLDASTSMVRMLWRIEKAET